MKTTKTLRREKVIKDLHNIDSRLKFINVNWNSEIKSAFNTTGSIDFVNLAHKNILLAEELVTTFKLIR